MEDDEVGMVICANRPPENFESWRLFETFSSLDPRRVDKHVETRLCREFIWKTYLYNRCGGGLWVCGHIYRNDCFMRQGTVYIPQDTWDRSLMNANLYAQILRSWHTTSSDIPYDPRIVSRVRIYS